MEIEFIFQIERQKISSAYSFNSYTIVMAANNNLSLDFTVLIYLYQLKCEGIIKKTYSGNNMALSDRNQIEHASK